MFFSGRGDASVAKSFLTFHLSSLSPCGFPIFPSITPTYPTAKPLSPALVYVSLLFSCLLFLLSIATAL